MPKTPDREPGNACGNDCGCKSGIDRRAFVKASGASLFALFGANFPAMAGPFENADFEKLVPADKKLAREWVESLFARGVPQVFRGEELRYIGMPVGGIGSGQVYLGGDGTLWHWDIFNQPISTGADHYAHPMEPTSPFEQGFSIAINGQTRTLDRDGFSDIRFRGAYPIGIVEFRDAAVPVEITLEAFSPFVPLDTDDSSLPATIMNYTIRNTDKNVIDVLLGGRLENAVCNSSRGVSAVRHNRVLRTDGITLLECTVEEDNAPKTAPKPDVVFEDWGKETYEGWTVDGTAFGAGPILKSSIPAYQGDVGGDTDRVVNSHASAPNGDEATGKLTSHTFEIQHRFVQLWVGGGNHKGKTCVNLVVAGSVVQSITGQANNKMTLQRFDAGCFQGKSAFIEIVDNETGGWGNIGVGKITFTDQPAFEGTISDLGDYGSMALALLGAPAEEASDDATAPMCDKLVGSIGRTLRVEPGQTASATFVLSWHFPNLKMDKLPGGRYYATLHESAAAVARYVHQNYDRLASGTRLWRDTWYDSTLPYWFLDRTMLNTSILATSTCYRFRDNRFYGWEGVGCCAGTCGHVWQYAHAVARLFPDLERSARELVDFGVALQPDGAIHFRGEHNDIPAIDAQAGTILRAYREHQMSSDNVFLTASWPNIKRATEWLIAKDANGDGIIESNQHNTLDTDWYGPVAWLSGLYIAALRAAAAMARELNDTGFADRCEAIFAQGQRNIVNQLFDGEYFINKPDPQHLDAINSGTGCEIDQVFGQSWAWQLGLERVYPEKETRAALQALWRYNFTPDVGPYRDVHKPGRWYAMSGEAGLLMCTFPRTDWNYDKAKGKGVEWAAGYFNECMNGFEYQVAGHMIWEGMVQEGLAVTRAVHDRYHASRRNPWNEVECGDHYARSMASYGVYLAACGFEYHGPNAHIGFAPRIAPENFKCAFTGATGWGTFAQTIDSAGRSAKVDVKWGSLQLRSVEFAVTEKPKTMSVSLAEKPLAATIVVKDERARIMFADTITISRGESLQFAFT